MMCHKDTVFIFTKRNCPDIFSFTCRRAMSRTKQYLPQKVSSTNAVLENSTQFQDKFLK